MILETLHLLFFKNYSEANLRLSPRINCFVGDNGSGKTNLLDAIHYLSLTKSAFTVSDAQSIKQEEEFFVVKGRFKQEATGSEQTEPAVTSEVIQVSLRAGQKKAVTHDKQAYERISDHIGRYPAVLISPYDTDLIRQGSEERRRYFDSLISQLDHEYLELLIAYNHVLRQRNSLLKLAAERQGGYDRDYLLVLDEQLVPAGQKIVEARQQFLEEFTPVFQRHYQQLADSRELVTLDYKTQLLEADFAKLLRVNERKDLTLQRTTVGPHKDDFVFLMDGLPVKSYGSQGQQKSYVISLKLAQFEILATRNQHKPLLLLDDIFDRLDEKRITRLLQLVADHTFGQVFLTDTHLDRTDRALADLSEQVSRFRVEKGTVVAL
ncbi:DNA replication/repair protein RecF [Hymenobacter sp. BT186]|uniref:DNA replication and repair protein RecF n=1 Tax=Hymenobacter telluris TaxID=2816474 RepID=A0A939JAC8_9BACT|nr:DNA replication/repair protein RecF [Hymenobacter telluris]MBO0359739.1 DNA replication/repair protein RecF [Hymenobacter telluris]MBW3375766.1 DNA replication/repair protein RecF [Hymenobacter norwichensis]